MLVQTIMSNNIFSHPCVMIGALTDVPNALTTAALFEVLGTSTSVGTDLVIEKSLALVMVGGGIGAWADVIVGGVACADSEVIVDMNANVSEVVITAPKFCLTAGLEDPILLW